MKKIVLSLISLASVSCVHGQTLNQNMQRVPLADGGHVEYSVRGEGPPILLIHGTGAADALALIFQSDELDGFQLILMHRRGYAGSSRLEGRFSMNEQANDALAVLDLLGLDSAHVAGHSYGTSVGLQMAVQAPDRVRTLTLLDMVPPPGLLPPPDQTSEATQPESITAGAVMIDVQRQLLEGTVTSKDAVETVFELAMGPDWRDFFDAIDSYEQTVNDFAATFPIEGEAMGEWQSRALILNNLKMPILVVWGEDQWQHPPNLGAAFKEALPQTRLRPIADADHASITQKPHVIAHVLSGFVLENQER